MDHNTAVQGYKHYLSSGNPSFLPQNLEKTAAAMHDQNVDAYKNYFKHRGMSKEARSGHPANIELARMVRPGIFPGLEDPSRQGSIRQPGEQSTIQSYMDGLMQQSPTAQAFRPGPHYDDLHEKAAAQRARLTGGLPDKLNQAGRVPPPAEGLPETPGGIADTGIQSTPAMATQTPTKTLAKTAGIMWWDVLYKTAAEYGGKHRGSGKITPYDSDSHSMVSGSKIDEGSKNDVVKIPRVNYGGTRDIDKNHYVRRSLQHEKVYGDEASHNKRIGAAQGANENLKKQNKPNSHIVGLLQELGKRYSQPQRNP